ncbi:2-hydroxyacid dehydrogenase [Aquamicrobium ahrensii]|uniref:Lactate dehydrogenase-like 2-hydroxyacid dehydrogenase n=1 Tax=Aquamicrobium ahrensii TaxID=469551 RepID=A0ABV2KHD5_9HYPH
MIPSAGAVTVLVSGNVHDHVVKRIGDEFRLIHIDRPDPSLLSPQDIARVRGLSAFGGIDANFIDVFPNLEIIANFGVGYDSVDAAHAAAKGVMVTNTPDVLTEEVADLTVGLLLATLREVPKAEAWLRQGKWVEEGGYRLSPLSLRGRHIGIFGLGRIGLAVARRLESFGVSIAYHNRRPVEGVPYAYFATLKGLAEAVDTLVSIAPGGAATEKAINADILKALGPRGVLINTGRGSTVDEDALAAALSGGAIAAAGLDVFADEPNVPQALLDAPNTVLLPHIASASALTRTAMADLCVDNLVSWFAERKPLTPVPETAHVKAK